MDRGSNQREKNFYCEYNNNEILVGGGVMRPKSGTCLKTNVLTKFQYDFRNKMPEALKEKLENLHGS